MRVSGKLMVSLDYLLSIVTPLSFLRAQIVPDLLYEFNYEHFFSKSTSHGDTTQQILFNKGYQNNMTAAAGGGGSGGGQPGTSSSTGGDEERAQKREEYKETFRVIKEMSDILNTGLDTESLGFCLRLCEEGVNPAALAMLLKDWRRSSSSNNSSSNNKNEVDGPGGGGGSGASGGGGHHRSVPNNGSGGSWME
jgi:mitotic-spindle organizing protein 1